MRISRGEPQARCTDFAAYRRRLLLGALAAAFALLPGLNGPDAASAAGGLPIRVDDTRDMPDANPGDCELEIPTINDDLPETGDFDVHDSVTFQGTTDGGVIIDGGTPPGNVAEAIGLDRLFEIHPSARNVTFSDLTLREGWSDDDGSAIQNWSSGVVRLERAKVLKNLATGAGAINNADPFDYEWLPADPIPMPPPGRIEIVDSTLSGNGSGAGGAAINNESEGSVSIVNSTISDNPGQMIQDPLDPEEMIPAPGVYEPTSSPIVNEGLYGGVGTIRITNSTVVRNYSEHDGGGLANLGDGVIIVEESEFSGNTTEATGGGIFSHGGELTVTHSKLSNNTAADGGAIYSVGADSAVGLRPRITITGTTVTGNDSVAPPGVALTGNIAVASGGGILNDGDGHLVMTDVEITNNKAGDDGAGLANQGRASMLLTRAIFEGNEANNEGGGLWSA